jgi:hypothetical protein
MVKVRLIYNWPIKIHDTKMGQMWRKITTSNHTHEQLAITYGSLPKVLSQPHSCLSIKFNYHSHHMNLKHMMLCDNSYNKIVGEKIQICNG